MPAALSISVSASTKPIPSRAASPHHADEHNGAAAKRVSDLRFHVVSLFPAVF